MTYKHLSNEARSYIVTNYKKGISAEQLARHYSVNQRTIKNIVNKYTKTGKIDREKGSGTKFDPHISKLIDDVVGDGSELSLREISDKVGNSKSSVHRYLHSNDFESLLEKKLPFENNNSLNQRKKWYDKYKRHNHANVIYSDETAFSLLPDKLCRHWVKRGKRPIIRRSGMCKKVHVWGCIQRDRKLVLHIYKPNMTADLYIEVLTQRLLPIIKECHKNRRRVLFQQDNARPHKAKSTMEFLTKNKVPVMDWPPYSPDLSPIENIWHIMKMRVKKVNTKTIPQLMRAIINVGNGIEIKVINNLIDSMPGRMKRLKENNYSTI
jgi:transposase/Zn/Cd-binding protein ZinT